MVLLNLRTNTAAPPTVPFGFRLGFWASILVGVAIVARRLFALQSRPVSSTAPPELTRLDGWFQMHAALTYAHILTALVFLFLLPFVFWSRTRTSALAHRAYYGLGGLVALTAYAMSTYSVGGWTERSAVLVFNTLFATELALSYRAWRTAAFANERRWTLRSTATVLGIATTRPVIGIFFATSRLTHWTPSQFFGPAFWIGFSINVIVMEIWLRNHMASTQGVGVNTTAPASSG